MEKGAFNPSRCEIKSAELTPFNAEGAKSNNIVAMIGSFNISQSVQHSAISGTLDIYDGIGLLEGLPLRGEERLDLVVFCYDLQTEVRLQCQVYQISDIEIREQMKGIAYTLHWITVPSFEASKKSVVKGFSRLPASTIAKDLFRNNFDKNMKKGSNKENEELPPKTEVYTLSDKRRFYLELTDDYMSITIPDLPPASAMKFVAKQTIGQSQSKGSLYRFFETFDGYYFVSDEWLYNYGNLNSIKGFEYSAFIDLSPDEHQQQITSFSHFANADRVNVGGDMNSGTYYNKILEVDILRRTAKTHDYKYEDYIKEFTDSSGKRANIKNDKHTKEFIDATFTPKNAKQYMLIRDYRTFTNSFVGPLKQEYYRPDKHYRDLIAKRSFYARHSQATATSALTSGRLDLKAGEVINVNVMDNDITNKTGQNKQLSGKYLINSVDNNVEDGNMTTGLILTKYDWSTAGADLRGNNK